MSHSTPVVLEKDHILDMLSQLESFRYLSWLGNLGDALIQFSTRQAFRDAALDFEGDVESCPVVFPGGGSLIPLYRSRRLLDEMDGQRRVLVLPHTMRGIAALVRNRPNLQAIARDRLSWQHLVDGGVPANRVLLSHDVAFWLEDWVKEQSWGSSTGTLMAFRNDLESSGRFSGFDAINFDLSSTWVSRWVDADQTARAATKFLEFIARFDAIVTDRLHVAIAAALLEKECLLFANSYGKNRAVYELSLRDRFPMVRWCDSLDEIPQSLLSSAVGRVAAQEAWVERAGSLHWSDRDNGPMSRTRTWMRRQSLSMKEELSRRCLLDRHRSRRRGRQPEKGIMQVSEGFSRLDLTASGSTLGVVDEWTRRARTGDRLALANYWKDVSARSRIDEVIDRYPMFDYRRAEPDLVMTKWD